MSPKNLSHSVYKFHSITAIMFVFSGLPGTSLETIINIIKIGLVRMSVLCSFINVTSSKLCKWKTWSFIRCSTVKVTSYNSRHYNVMTLSFLNHWQAPAIAKAVLLFGPIPPPPTHMYPVWGLPNEFYAAMRIMTHLDNTHYLSSLWSDLSKWGHFLYYWISGSQIWGPLYLSYLPKSLS